MSTPDAMPATDFKPIFTGGRSLLGLRILGLCSIVIWYFTMGFAWEILTSFGLNPADGYDGQLAPATHRVGLALAVAVTASGFLFFMVFMGHQVVTRILLSEDRQTLRIETMGFWKWGRMEIPEQNLIGASEEHHQAGNSAVTVPRLRIRIRDRKWSLWIQQPGNVLDTAAFRRYVLRKKRGR